MNDIIFSYTRAEAIADGVLIDVTKLAKEAGFRVPLALTHAAWAEAVAVTREDECQEETGRLWDVLNVLRYEALRAKNESLLFFEVLISKGGKPPRPVRLKAHIGPGDDGASVLTVMSPNED